MIRTLLWSVVAFCTLGAIWFLAHTATLISTWRRERREAKQWAMDPVRKLRR